MCGAASGCGAFGEFVRYGNGYVIVTARLVGGSSVLSKKCGESPAANDAPL